LSEKLLILSAEEAERLLDWGLVDTIREVLESDAVAPTRAALTHSKVWIGAMPAAGLGLQTVKVVGVYPGNPSRGLPLVRGILIALRESDGEPLLLSDAGPPTAYRTASASCVALEELGFQGSDSTVAIVGAGVQGGYHAFCVKERLGARRFIVFDVSKDKARALAERLGSEAVIAGSLREVYAADLIITATTSRKPVIEGSKLRSGSTVVSIGAPKPIVELDQDVLRRAACIIVDTVEGFMAEAGEAALLPEGVEVVGLREIVRGEKECRHGDVAVYKSVGTALFDLAAALYMVRRSSLV
jgi:alanine dehydrogenase